MSRYGILAVAMGFCLSACTAQSTYNKQVQVWEKGKAALLGMPLERLLACAGQPYDTKETGTGADLLYGYTERMTYSSSWCVLAVSIEDGKVSRFTTRSGNPGGLTDGSSTCSLAVDRCVSDGMLEIEAAGTPGTVSVERIKSGGAQAVVLASQHGEQGAKEGVRSVADMLGQLRSMTTPNAPVSTGLPIDTNRPPGVGSQIYGRPQVLGGGGMQKTPGGAVDEITALTTPSGVTSTSTGSSSAPEFGSPTCPRSLAHLATFLPSYGEAELNALRTQILSEDLYAAMQRAILSGRTPRQVAGLALQQSEEFRKGIPQAEACIRQSTTNPDQILRALQTGRYDLSRRTRSLSEACVKAYVAFYYGLVANQETALVMSCMAKGRF